MEREPPRSGENGSERGRLSLLTSVGIMFPASIAIGAGFGYYLDGKLHTFPWLFIVFLLFGVASGFINLVRVSRQFDRTD